MARVVSFGISYIACLSLPNCLHGLNMARVVPSRIPYIAWLKRGTDDPLGCEPFAGENFMLPYRIWNALLGKLDCIVAGGHKWARFKCFMENCNAPTLIFVIAWKQHGMQVKDSTCHNYFLHGFETMSIFE